MDCVKIMFRILEASVDWLRRELRKSEAVEK